MPSLLDAMVSPQTACQRAIAAAETSHGVPAGFLLAIGRVESGRLDAKSGTVQPWPWTIDIGGKGSFFATKSEAIAAVEAARDQGTQSIDVGCMQVNLLQHPQAFATLDDAFDPVINANYAARFLVDLQRESGDWVSAAGLYHSRTEELAAPYRNAVVLRFGGATGLAAARPAPRPAEILAAAWAATLPQPTREHQDSGDTMLHLWPKPLAKPTVASGTPGSRVRLTAR